MSGDRDTRAPEKWEIEADAAFARGVSLGLRAWHEEWSPEGVRRLMARVEAMHDEVRLARREQRLAALPTVSLKIVTVSGAA